MWVVSSSPLGRPTFQPHSRGRVEVGVAHAVCIGEKPFWKQYTIPEDTGLLHTTLPGAHQLHHDEPTGRQLETCMLADRSRQVSSGYAPSAAVRSKSLTSPTSTSFRTSSRGHTFVTSPSRRWHTARPIPSRHLTPFRSQESSLWRVMSKADLAESFVESQYKLSLLSNTSLMADGRLRFGLVRRKRFL